MSRGRTLWEMLMDWVQGPVELRHYNPLRARVGSPVTIDTVDLKEHNFFVKELRSYERRIGARHFDFIDYVLQARGTKGDEITVRLRLVPVEGAGPGGLSHHALVLQLDDEFGYNEDFDQVVRDTTRKFQVMQDGQVVEEFYRINEVDDPYQAEVTVMVDINEDGSVDRSEVAKLRLEYWDYWREVSDEAGQPLKDYLFVELDNNNGWFQIWRGAEVDAQRVMVL
jgi:hypothetical protein